MPEPVILGAYVVAACRRLAASLLIIGDVLGPGYAGIRWAAAFS